LDGKAIALVGCGTLGSHLAKFLMQGGAGASAPLTLIDGQVLSAGNIGRHYLGHSRIGETKASALAEELKSFHPQCDIRATVGDALAQKTVLADANLLVDATGDWNTQYALNELFYEDGISADAILHCWISGNGAAVQAFLNVRGDECCFRCLRPSMDAGPRFPALKPGVEANMAPATCGDGNYIPYSVAAPATAAGLACDMAIGWANDKPGARLRTIVLDHERGIVRKPTSPSAHKSCPSCLARDRS
jgi:molybdopterin/thiamine biosynthesis adenylyltransferase